MKKILLAIVLLMYSSCEKEVTITITFTVKNQTEHFIQITGYDRLVDCFEIDTSENVDSENISLLANTEYVVNSGEDIYNSQSIFKSDIYIDSITIVFDSARIIVFACNSPVGLMCSDDYNLLSYINYTREITTPMYDKEERNYTFVFTEEDFEFASEIKK